MFLMETNVDPMLPGSRLNADHPKNGVLIPRLITDMTLFDRKLL